MDRIGVEPDICNGQPTIKGTRFTARLFGARQDHRAACSASRTWPWIAAAEGTTQGAAAPKGQIIS
jgi:hypothetical protein